MLFTTEIAPLYMAYNFLFGEPVEINFPLANVNSEKLQRRSQQRADGDSRVNTVHPLISDWLNNPLFPLLPWKQDADFQTNCGSTWLSYCWMRNQLKVQSISSQCPRVRCCSVFTPGYNHSKTNLPSHLNLLAATEACLDQVRTDMACHFVSALPSNAVNINIPIKNLCLHCGGGPARSRWRSQSEYIISPNSWLNQHSEWIWKQENASGQEQPSKEETTTEKVDLAPLLSPCFKHSAFRGLKQYLWICIFKCYSLGVFSLPKQTMCFCHLLSYSKSFCLWQGVMEEKGRIWKSNQITRRCCHTWGCL